MRAKGRRSSTCTSPCGSDATRLESNATTEPPHLAATPLFPTRHPSGGVTSCGSPSRSFRHLQLTRGPFACLPGRG